MEVVDAIELLPRSILLEEVNEALETGTGGPSISSSGSVVLLLLLSLLLLGLLLCM